MKIRDGFVVRDVGGKTYVVAVGELSKSFSCMITLNETGKLIWQTLETARQRKRLLKKSFPFTRVLIKKRLKRTLRSS